MADHQPLSSAERGWLRRALAEDLPDAVIYADREGAIRHWNAGATRIFGFTEEEALGARLDIIIPEPQRARHWAGYRRMMEEGSSRHGADDLLWVPALAKDGRRLSVQFTVAPVRDDEGAVAGIAAVLRDVTGLYEELKRLRSAAGPA